MIESYFILQNKDLGKDSIIAVPENLYNERLEQIFDVVGFMKNVDESDFQEHIDFMHRFIPIELSKTLSKPDNKLEKNITKGLESICNNNCRNLDINRALQNQEIKNMILNYEIVSGDIYLVRYSGKYKKEENSFSRSIAYVVSSDELIYTLTNKLYINETEIELPQGDLRFFHEHVQSKSPMEVFKSGYIKLHRMTLNPYISNNRKGNSSSYGPWIIERRDLTEKKISMMIEMSDN